MQPAVAHDLAARRFLPIVKFPLADWIDAHEGCRHNLGESGMAGVVRPVRPSPAQVRAADPNALRRILADELDVAPDRLFLTHGATEANAWAVHYLARRGRGGPGAARVRFPEYPPLVDVARSAGFRLTEAGRRPSVAILSNPRNPEGHRLAAEDLFRWADGARDLVVDETFREFARSPTIGDGRPGVWRTGSFTKFFGGDSLRVGFLVVPEREAAAYARFHGLVVDELAPVAVAGALATWRARDRLRRTVERVWLGNRKVWRRAFPDAPPLASSVFFDRPVRPNGRALAERCLARSVLVCPGDLFGDPSGVRLGLTRPTFLRDLAAYLRVRDGRTLSGAR